MKKKVLIIITIVIILIIGIIATLIAIDVADKAKYEYTIEKVTEINYNIINKDERYGVIDRQGNIVVEPIYDIIQIPNPSKPVFICMSNYDIQEKEYTTNVFNEKGEEIFQGYQYIQAIPNETTEDGIPFEKTVLQYKRNGKYGLLNINGTEVTEAKYDQINSMTYKEGMLLVSQNEKYGVINMNGITVIDIEYDSITADNYYNENTKYQTAGFIVGKQQEDSYKYGYINYKGKQILETEYTEIERVTGIKNDKDIYLVALKNGQAGLLKNKEIVLNYEYEDISYNAYNNIFIIQSEGKQGISDEKGNMIITPEYDNILVSGIYINAEKDGEIMVLDIDGNPVPETDILAKIPTEDEQHFIITDKDGIYKIIDLEGNIVIDKSYSYIEEVYNNYYIVGSKNKNGIINITGKSMLELKYNSIFKIEGTELVEANILETNTIVLLNKNMEKIAEMKNAVMEVKDNYVHIYNEKENKYFDFKGNEVSYQELYPNNELYATKIDDNWGFADKDGNIKVQTKYEKVTEFNEYGYAGIKEDGKWGSIDINGNIVQEPIYEINWENPKFIGKYYKEVEWYGELYYTDKISNEKDEEI